MSDQKRLKLLFVITKSNFGGAQRYVFDLATGFQNANYEVTVAFGGIGKAGAPDGILAVNLRQVGINGIFIQNFTRDISFSREIKLLRELTQIFRKESPDVVHLNSSKAGGVGALAARFAGIQNIIFTSHGLPYDEDRGTLIRLFRWFATWVTFLLVHQVILISKDTFERARRSPFCKHKMHLIYNGIAEKDLMPRDEARSKLIPNHIPEVRWIGTISELTRNKGLTYLIEAARLLKERGGLFELGIIGFGEDYEFFKQLILKYNLNQQVHLLGFVVDAARYLAAFDIFTLTSVKEGHPYVLLEAAQAHCAVVGSRIPGIVDIVDQKTGILVEPKNIAEIADALELLIRKPAKCKELGQALYTNVQKKFSLEKMLEATEKLYR